MDSMSEDMKTELEVLGQVQGEHIVQLLGACFERKCLIYSYMENGSLHDWLGTEKGRKSLTLVRRVSAMRDTAKGLLVLHHREPAVCHRDIKPGNILLGSMFNAKLGDVGVAKVIPTTPQFEVG